MKDEKRDDLVKYAGQQVSDGDQAEAYASYIQGHVQALSGGKTYGRARWPTTAPPRPRWTGPGRQDRGRTCHAAGHGDQAQPAA